jgi:glyoxylase-like metal-dependent hydrolase (beta-lactamase superfamily II)
MEDNMRKIPIVFMVVIMLIVTKFVNAEEKPAVFTYQLGDFRLIALQNQKIMHNLALFRHENPDVLEAALNEKLPNASALNEFIVDTGNNKILFDTGLRDGKILERLKQVDITPEEIDTIILTHMHPDHVGGLLTEDHLPVFPNAKIYVSEEEVEGNPDEFVMAAYKERIVQFKQDALIAEGIKSIPAFGHTSGHTMFLVTSKGQNLLIWGDLVHATVQFKYPGVYLTYDNNPEEAVEIREKILERLSYEDTIAAGMHLIYPGMGNIVKTKTWYEFVPLTKEK